MQYLREDFPKLLERLKTEDLLGTESMYGYPNSLLRVEGYVLLQEALLRRAATARFEEAKQRFCKFLATTHYVD